jgi:hypothetical protein
MTHINELEGSVRYFSPKPSVWVVGDRVSDMFDWHVCVRLEVDIPSGPACFRNGIWRLVVLQDTVNFWDSLKEFSELCDIFTEGNGAA